MVDFAIAEGVGALLIAGDLFDGRERSARTAAFLVREFDRLSAAGIRVFCIRGNHDAENPASNAIEMPANVHVFDGRGGKVQLGETGIWIHGVSFSRKQAPESLLPRFAPPVPGAVNIGLLHTSLAGAPGHDPYAPCTVAELVAHGFDYWALGHVHKRTVHADGPWVVMPGMPQGRDIAEEGPKSATLLTVGDDGIAVEEVPTSAVEFRRSTVDVGEAEDDEALRRALRTHLEAEAAATVSDAAILRLSLIGRTGRTWALRRDADLWRQQASDLAEGTGGLWIEALEIGTAPPTAAAASSDAASELGALMDAIRGEESFHIQARDELEQTLAQLPAERRRALAGDEAALDDLAARLASDGALAMLARMKGAGS